MKKIVLKLDLTDQKIKDKVMKKVSCQPGLESLALDPKDKTLTVIGDIDVMDMVVKLNKICHAKIVSVGPAKEPAKKKDKNKREEVEKTKRQCPKPCPPPPLGDKKKDGPKKDLAQLMRAHQQHRQKAPLPPPPRPRLPAPPRLHRIVVEERRRILAVSFVEK